MKARLEPRINLEGRTALETVIPLATPFIVFVDPASSCNFKCTFCPTGHRDMIAETGRFQGVMKFDVFQKIVDDLGEFDKPIKVLRMYKDGEPFLNKRLADMVAYAKRSKHVEYIDTTTNGTFLSPDRVGPVLEAGIDKINISVDGMTEETYVQFTGFKFDFKKFVDNVKWLYANKGNCEIVVKIPGELITEAQRQEFFDTFGDHCDRIFVENFAPCWPEFDIEKHTGVKISKGIYQQDIGDTDTCPYIFYGYSVNADGLVSSCFLDWGRKLIIGDVRQQSMKEIWNSERDECAAPAASRGTPAAERRLRQLRTAQPLPARQYRRAPPGAAGRSSRRSSPSIRTSRRRAAPIANSRPWRRNEDPACHAASRRRRRQSACGHQRRLAQEAVEQTFLLLEEPRDRRYVGHDRSRRRARHRRRRSRSGGAPGGRGRHRPVRILESSAPVRMPGALRISRDAQRVLVAYFGPRQAADSARADRRRPGASSSRPRLRAPFPRSPVCLEAAPQKIAVINSGFGFPDGAPRRPRRTESRPSPISGPSIS